jgi:hypothetical protein
VRVIAFLLLLPALAWAQAEPAPPGYIPPGRHEPASPPPSPYKWHIALDARLAVPLGNMPPHLRPVGYGGGVQVTRALVDVGRMRFGVAGDFAYQRIPSSQSDEFLSHMTFAALAVLDGWFDRVRPWLAAGAGLSVAEYRLPATVAMPMAIDSNNVVPLVEVGLGLDVELARNIDVGVAGEFDFTFSSLTVGAPPVTAFQPGLFSVRLGVGFRF